MKKGNYKWEIIPISAEESAKWQAIAGKPIWDQWVKEVEAKGLPGKKALDLHLELQKKYQR
jgi:hypothetical protein